MISVWTKIFLSDTGLNMDGAKIVKGYTQKLKYISVPLPQCCKIVKEYISILSFSCYFLYTIVVTSFTLSASTHNILPYVLHFLLFPQCFLTFHEQIPPFSLHISCHLQTEYFKQIYIWMERRMKGAGP